MRQLVRVNRRSLGSSNLIFRRKIFTYNKTPYSCAGFTTNSKPWLPVNPNYWELNLQAQRKNFRSHYNVYRRLVQLRSHPTFQYGSLNIFTFGDWVLVFTRFETIGSIFTPIERLRSLTDFLCLESWTTTIR